MPEYRDTEFYFITGLDAVLDIVSWKNPEEIMSLCKFVAVSRYGYTHSRMQELPESKVLIIPRDHIAISSTGRGKWMNEHKFLSLVVVTSEVLYKHLCHHGSKSLMKRYKSILTVVAIRLGIAACGSRSIPYFIRNQQTYSMRSRVL